MESFSLYVEPRRRGVAIFHLDYDWVCYAALHSYKKTPYSSKNFWPPLIAAFPTFASRSFHLGTRRDMFLKTQVAAARGREGNPMEAWKSFASSKRETCCLCAEIKIVDFTG